MRELIQLRCKRCGNAMIYHRSADPDLPEDCCFIESSNCDLCDDGDYGSETLLNEKRKKIDTEWLS